MLVQHASGKSYSSQGTFQIHRKETFQMKCFVGLDVSSQKLDACIMLSDDANVPFRASLANDK